MLTINEATLEMHFHAALMDLFRETLGLGPTGSIEFFKYSPQLEKFVGFDQAYVKTEMSGEELYDELEATGCPPLPPINTLSGSGRDASPSGATACTICTFSV